MPLTIRWGAPGSYKTSYAVEVHLIPAVLEHRHIITNIRGCTLERIWRLYNPEEPIPENVFFYNIGDTVSKRTLHLLRHFFCWIPKGTLLILDESQLIYPKDRFHIHEFTQETFQSDELTKKIAKDYSDASWVAQNQEKLKQSFLESHSETDLETDSYVSFLRESLVRPTNLAEAFDMHRHHGWDIILTMPNITAVNRYIRGVAEGAYFQRNQSVVGGRLFRGRFLEVFHDAGNRGKSNADIIVKSQHKVDKKVFKCFDSTATGGYSDAIAGVSLFQNPRILIASSIVSMVFVFLLYQIFSGAVPSFYQRFYGGAEASEIIDAEASEIAVEPSNFPDSGEINKLASSDFIHKLRKEKEIYRDKNPKQFNPFKNARIYIDGVGIFGDKISLAMSVHHQNNTITQIRSNEVLEKMGYQLTIYSTCMYRLDWEGKFYRYVYCSPQKNEEEEERRKVSLFGSEIN